MNIPSWARPTRCIDGRRWRHDPQHDDPYLETDIGQCEDCGGRGCDLADPASAIDDIRADLAAITRGEP